MAPLEAPAHLDGALEWHPEGSGDANPAARLHSKCAAAASSRMAPQQHWPERRGFGGSLHKECKLI